MCSNRTLAIRLTVIIIIIKQGKYFCFILVCWTNSCQCRGDLLEYRPDLKWYEETFLRECKRWMAKWTESSPAQYPDLETALRVATEASYPNIRLCMMVLLCMPVSTATAERSFSTMRRVKTYLRNTMTTERLSGLGLLNIISKPWNQRGASGWCFCPPQRASSCLNFQGLKISI